jgi:S-DNA-T family DNA segregation ATPase FtsK/SpoIIIE
MSAPLFLPREKPTAVPAKSTGFRRGPEALALLLFTFAAYLVLALASLECSPLDPELVGDNWVGPVGAAIAEVLVRGFGVVAWLFPLELAILGRPLLQRRSPELSGLRIAGDLVVAMVLSALVHIAAPEATAFGHMPLGGNVGLLFGELFEALFSSVGSYLIGGSIVGLILIGRSSFSFIEWCEYAAHLLERVMRRLGYWVRRSAHAWGTAKWLRRAASHQTDVGNDAFGDELAPAGVGLVAPLPEWQPTERTGIPPLALAGSLKRQFIDLLPDTSQDNTKEAPNDSTKTGSKREPLPPPEERPVAPPRARRAAKLKAQEPPSEQPQVTDPDATPVVPTVVPELVAPKPKTERAKTKAAHPTPMESVEPTLNEAEATPVKPTKAAKPPSIKPPAEITIVDTRSNIEVERAPVQKSAASRGFRLPETDILERPSHETLTIDKDRVVELADRLEKTLADYGVVGRVEEVHPGPTVTTYEFSPQAGTKVSKVASLADDLALGLSRKVRIIAPIPGKARIGFELPNDERIPVNLRELIEDQRFKKLGEKVPLPVVLGRDIVGAPFYADLAAMPHVIVAGATGAGKSVGLNVMLSSLLFKRSPDDLRMLMIDPKVVELAPFDGIPHMLLPVVTDMKQAAKALKWAVDEMERRYQAFAIAGTKNIGTYNRWVERVAAGELPAPKPEEVTAIAADGRTVSVPVAKDGGDGTYLPGRMPHIVIVVDEFADLIMQQGKEVEASVARLAQKARAAGMHVVLATQRPSVDVITGMIKANFPTRIAFRVAQKVDSRTILDEMGAEVLLGKGDMLVKLNGATDTHRVQCPFISEEEVDALTSHLRKQGSPVYYDEILKGGEDEESGDANADEGLDPRFDEAVRIVAETQRCSTSWLQRRMTIGYNRAAKIVEAMEQRGIVGPANGAKDREIYVNDVS